MNAIGGRIGYLATGLATAIVVVALGILPFLTPQWVAFEQGRSSATAWTGFTTEELRAATDAILSDLMFGADFAVEINGTPVLNEREQAHMADVRTVFRGLWILTAASLVVLIVASRSRDRGRMWRAVRRGAFGLIVALVIAGVVALLAFDQLFELFHRIFFPAGSYLFDPATDRLVQLFPFQFWDETSLVVGSLITAISLVVAFVAGRRAERSEAMRSVVDLAPVAESGS